jgi:hypothetical protein
MLDLLYLQGLKVHVVSDRETPGKDAVNLFTRLSKFRVQGLDLGRLRLGMETSGFLLQAITFARIRSYGGSSCSLSCVKASVSFTLRGGTGTGSGGLLLAALFCGLLV